MNKFVKRYPRAFIHKRAHAIRLYILTAPGETPHHGNRVHVTWPRKSDELHTQAIAIVDTHRNEPS